MHWLDLAIVAVVAWLTWRGLAAGLIREVVTAAALIGGAVLAGRFYPELSADIAFLIEDDTWRRLAAFASIFVGTLVLGQIAASLLRKSASLLMLGVYDRAGGAAFGLAKGVLLVEVLLLAALAFPVSGVAEEAIAGSRVAEAFLDGVPVALELLPSEFADAAARLGIGAAASR